MRGATQVLLHARYCSRIHVDHLYMSNGIPKIPTLRETTPSLSRLYVDKEINQFLSQTAQAMSTFVANDIVRASADFGRSGPFVEYERRIASGELADGDTFQVDTLRLLQRLYQQLVDHEDICKLDRY